MTEGFVYEHEKAASMCVHSQVISSQCRATFDNHDTVTNGEGSEFVTRFWENSCIREEESHKTLG
jgi:hypothetical protein